MPNQDLTHLRPETHSDEIDLAELVRNLLTQWKLICGITFLGAMLSITIALLLPSEYRVEAIFDKPSTADIQPLLSQTLIPLTRQEVLDSFLKNLTSRPLIEQALESQGLLKSDDNHALEAEDRFSLVTLVADSILIAPATYDFIETNENSATEFDQISFSVLSSQPDQTVLWMNELLQLASNKTTKDISRDIIGQRNIEVARLNNQLEQIKSASIAKREQDIDHLESALAIATELKITEPTSWSALVHGNGNVQLLNEQPEKEADFLKGSRILAAELSVLKNSPVQLNNLTTTSVDQEGFATAQIISPNTIKGEISTLEKLSIDESNIQYIDLGTKALAPANAEKPNRKLIVVITTLLAGFFALIVALIRLAVRK